jgi:uncharacterized protein YegJ (DUF2314 family)
MRSTIYAAAVLILLGGGCWFFFSVSGGTVVAIVEDLVARVEVMVSIGADLVDEPDMAAASRKARETLPEFLALARAPRPSVTGLAVRIAIPAGDSNEYFWLTEFAQRGDKYAGRVIITPRMAKQAKVGQIVEFTEAEIIDWLYMEDGEMRGNFGACAVFKHLPSVRKHNGLTCDS